MRVSLQEKMVLEDVFEESASTIESEKSTGFWVMPLLERMYLKGTLMFMRSR